MEECEEEGDEDEICQEQVRRRQHSSSDMDCEAKTESQAGSLDVQRSLQDASSADGRPPTSRPATMGRCVASSRPSPGLRPIKANLEWTRRSLNNG